MKAILIKSKSGKIKSATCGRAVDLLKKARAIKCAEDFGKDCDTVEVWTRAGGMVKRVSLENIKAQQSINLPSE